MFTKLEKTNSKFTTGNIKNWFIRLEIISSEADESL